MTDGLVVVIPFYNFMYDNLLNDVYLRQIDEFERQGVNHITVEMGLDGEFTLPHDSRIIKINTGSAIWHKEQIVNMAFDELKSSKIAWVDSGTILQDGWVEKVEESLESHDVVQCFSHQYWLGESGDIEEILPGYMFSGIYGMRGGNVGYGGAWAATSRFFREVGLYQYCIVGGGDIVFCSGMVEKHHTLTTQRYSKEHLKSIFDWISLAYKMELRVGFVFGEWMHLWHGDRNNRHYLNRMSILMDKGFDPHTDVETRNGVLELTSDRLRGDIANYFKKRLPL